MVDEYIRKADAVEALDGKIIVTGHENADAVLQYMKDISNKIKSIEPADVAPVVHAYWIDTDNYYRRWRCSACSNHTKEAHPPVCPFCGAKMDAQGEE